MVDGEREGKESRGLEYGLDGEITEILTAVVESNTPSEE